MSDNELLTYTSIRMGLRPPRVAIVMNGGHHWDYFVRLALHAATLHWGGRGFILVPHQDGYVNPLLLRLAAAYDPDYVVQLQLTLSQYEVARPGQLPLMKNGDNLTGAERAEFIRQYPDRIIPDHAGERARQKVAESCSPHRKTIKDDKRVEEVTQLYTTDGSSRLPLASAVKQPSIGPALSTPASWAGPAGAATAAYCGAIEVPQPGNSEPRDTDVRRRLINWFLNIDQLSREPLPEIAWYPTVVLSVDPSTLPHAFERTLGGLAWICQGVRQRRTEIVIGDQAADFALFLGLERLYGNTVWLPSDWWPVPNGHPPSTTALALQARLDRAIFEDRSLNIVTASLAEDDVQKVAERLRNPPMRIDDDSDGTDSYANAITTDRLLFPMGGRFHLALANDFERQLALPVYSNHEGGLTLASPAPPPTPQDPDVSAAEIGLQVSVRFEGDVMPSGRGLDGSALTAPGENPHSTWVRSARDGVTYESLRYDFVAAGAPYDARVARPRLRVLGVLEWIRQMARQSDLEVRVSEPGRRAETLESQLGSRERLAEIMASSYRAALRAFLPAGKDTRSSYPNNDGLVLNRRGFLSFKGVLAQISEDEDGNARSFLDELLRSRTLRRGLVLGCSDCGEVAFVPIDELGQTNTCPRCGAQNELTQKRWKQPVREPNWYYDLHPMARRLLGDNGDVPLILSDYLRSRASVFSDTPEIEFLSDDGRIGEVDLIASMDGKVVVAEANSSGSLQRKAGKAREGRKLLRVASVLSADEVVLATTADSWEGDLSTYMRHEAAEESFPSASSPDLVLISRLGKNQPEETRVALDRY